MLARVRGQQTQDDLTVELILQKAKQENSNTTRRVAGARRGPRRGPLRGAPIDPETIAHMINENVLRRGFSQESPQINQLVNGQEESNFYS